MIGITCKYAPAELLQAFGLDTEIISPAMLDSGCSDSCMHPNQCAYVQGIRQTIASGKYEGIVLTSCCDSIRRLSDLLKQEYPDLFVRILDLPHDTGKAAVTYYSHQLTQLIHDCEEHWHTSYHPERLSAILASMQEKETEETSGIRIAIAGARHTAELNEILHRFGASVSVDLSCAAQQRYFHSLSGTAEEQLEDYAYQLLHQLPCLRMTDTEARAKALQKLETCDGILYHTVKFCDMYSYEFSREASQMHVPVLRLESDLSSRSLEQSRTRIEAFLESLQKGNGMMNTVKTDHPGTAVLGIDSGSATTCAVLMNRDRRILASALIRTGAGSVESARAVKKEVMEKAGLQDSDLIRTVSTGYGRVSIPFADHEVTEITCHARGARYFDPKVRTILDIGGQDSKAIHLDENGEVSDFAMNDKCAAGTGRFLETMASILQVPVSELGPLSLKSQKRIDISSQCTVFAESEVIALIADNQKKEDIAAAVHRAVARKAVALLKRAGMEAPCMMSGGVALNTGMIQAVEEACGMKFETAADPEAVGAAGACISALMEIIPVK